VCNRTRKQTYLFNKYQACKALIAEKRATAKRLELEADVLEERKERLGIDWKRAVEKGE
jgi:hypothetical protein